MKRIWLLAAAQLALGSAWAQPIDSRIVSTSFNVGACGGFYVDGVKYERAAFFLWPENSVHYVALENPHIRDINVGTERCVPGSGWTDNLGRSYPSSTSVVADRNVSEYKSSSTLEHKVRIVIPGTPSVFFQCPAQLISPIEPWMEREFGYVLTAGGSGECIDRSTDMWVSAGTSLSLLAYPPRGQAFLHWTSTLLAQPVATHTLNVTINYTALIVAEFTPAARYRFVTEPAGMQVLVDRTPVTTPFEINWAMGSQHTLGPVAPQRAPNGELHVWESWSSGAAENHTITVPHVSQLYTLTAKYTRGASFGFRTEPAGLQLVIDGVPTTVGNNFVWLPGSKHTVSAPAQQERNGRRYAFQGWSNGGAAEQEFVAGGELQGLVATYEMLGLLTVRALPVEVPVTVDGEPCTTPCLVHRRAGQTARIAAAASVPSEPGSRLDFRAWQDAASAERTWTATTADEVITAVYDMKYRIEVAASPAGAADFRFEPASPDGYYTAGTDVTVTAEPHRGYRLQYWDGDLSGAGPSASVWLGKPCSALAVFEKFKVYGPAAVRNAAGQTPDAEVAAGSVISIYGENVAPLVEAGPSSPLAQTIAGVTVQVQDRFLPLVSVSPEEILAQLPSDLPAGDYDLVVHNDGLPDIPAKFKLARNAPGLFATQVETRSYALAWHEDGTAVTAESPARRGEVVTILGTGFGPYKSGALDGFAVPEGLKMELQDAVELRAGDLVVQPESLLAATGRVGCVAIKLKIADPLPAGAAVEFRAVVNGRSSNTVLLPLK